MLPTCQWLRAGAFTVAVVVLTACADEHDEPAPEAESWAVTAWGRLYEVFPEIDPLVDGVVSRAHTHVTILDGFLPLTEGEVEIVLAGNGAEQVFNATEAVRPGIFNVDMEPRGVGEYGLRFRIRSSAGNEEIDGGRVRVGAPEEPGGLIAPAQPQQEVDGEPVSFLKEQQWRTRFATAWVEQGALPRVASGLARVQPPAGGEVLITAPVDGVLQARPWPFTGERVGAGTKLFELVPRVAAESSLPELQAEFAAQETELTAARVRLGRLEELHAIEATSQREVEEARTRVTNLEVRLDAARRDLASAQAVREGRGGGNAHALRAPFAGAVAAVTASPGAAVDAGAELARLVRTDRVWLEVQLRPDEARALAAEGAAGIVIQDSEGPPIELGSEEVRRVSVSPEVDPIKGTIQALLEVGGDAGLLLGTTVEAQVRLPTQVAGIVIPSTALVDDGGVTVVYLQLEGESFARHEIGIVARQGGRSLVDGLLLGQRVVTEGGDAIRRATLMSKGAGEGHVH